MRVLYSHYLIDDDHPAARMVQSIARELQGLGMEVRVHRCLGPAASKGVAGGGQPATAATGGLARRVKDRLWFARTLARNRGLARTDAAAISQFRPDVILAREDAYRTSMVGAAKATGVPLVTYADAPVAYEVRTFYNKPRWHPPRVLEAVEKRWLKQSRAVITPTHAGAGVLAAYGLDVPIHAISNGVDPAQFPALTSEAKQQRRRELGLPAVGLVVGYQGSFRNFHGIDLLCELVRATAGQNGIHWLLVGDGPERHKLLEAAAGNRAVTLVGRQPSERMGDFVSVMDVGISTHVFVPGPFYFCPLKILEYAAAGCAVIASAQGDVPRLLDNGRVGILLDGPEPERWIQALRVLATDPAKVRRLGELASKWVEHNFTWRHTAEGVAGVLESVLAESAGRRVERSVTGQ